MSILWFGAEDIDFPNGVVPLVRTGGFRSGWARCALGNDSNGSPTNAVAIGCTFPGGAVTSCWLSFWCYAANQGNANYMLAGLTRSGKAAGDGIYVGCGNPEAYLRLVTFNGASQALLGSQAAAPLLTTQNLHKIDMQVSSYGANATVNVYCDGLLALTFTGDVRISSLTDLDRVGIVGEPYGTRHVISEVIVADQDTRLMNLSAHNPEAAGDQNQWTGLFSDVDEITKDDNDYVYVNAADQEIDLNLTAPPSGAFRVLALKIVARASKSADASVGTLKLGARLGGTSDVDAGHALDTGWQTYERFTATINGNSLSLTDMGNLQVALKSAA